MKKMKMRHSIELSFCGQRFVSDIQVMRVAKICMHVTPSTRHLSPMAGRKIKLVDRAGKGQYVALTSSPGRSLGILGYGETSMTEFGKTVWHLWKTAVVLGLSVILLTACDMQAFDLFKPKQSSDEQTAPSETPAAQSEARDVEAPEIFQTTDMGLWDGRPSFGGQWVAHPDVEEPGRVIILNTANSKSIEGALFQRVREVSGPRFQVSSDAADALGMLAGTPTQLKVTALRREDVSTDGPVDVSDSTSDDEADIVDGSATE